MPTKKQNDVQLTHIRIVNQDYGSRLEEPRITSFDVVPPKEYGDLQVAYTIEPGKEYYLLYCMYVTGDSNGSTLGCICYVNLYQTYDQAHENAQRIEKHYEDWASYGAARKRDSSVELISPSGNPYKQYTPWTGYFEHLTSVNIIPLYQTNNSNRYYHKRVGY